MIYLILIVLFLLLILGPQYWAKSILNKHNQSQSNIQGTGGELVEHLKKKFSLNELKVETTRIGDHYDPNKKAVRLTESNMNGRSLTAVAVATHEFGHALQDSQNYKPLTVRTHLVKFAQQAEKIGSLAIFALPLLALSPLSARSAPVIILIIIASMAVSCVVHLITLPVEFDASFRRALPILKDGQYVEKKDLFIVRKILTACALTYLASSLSGLLNFWRWFSFLRR